MGGEPLELDASDILQYIWKKVGDHLIIFLS